MKKLLKPAKKRDPEPSEQDGELIELKMKVTENEADLNDSEEEILDLSNEIPLNERESLDTGFIELKEKVTENEEEILDLTSGIPSDKQENLDAGFLDLNEKFTEDEEDILDLRDGNPPDERDAFDTGFIDLNERITADEEEILDLSNKIPPDEQESLDTGFLDLTDEISSLPPSLDMDQPRDKGGKTSDNVIHLSDLTFSKTPENSDDIDDIDDILDLGSEVFQTDEEEDDDDDLNQLTEQLESAISTSYGEEDDESIEKLPEANLIEVEDDDEKIDSFGLLPEAEPGMADNIESLGLEDLDDTTTFADIGNHIADKMPDLSMEADDFENENENLTDDSMDEEISEAALELNRAMEADRKSNYQDSVSNEYNSEINKIRNKLDNVFPEEDSEDPLGVFDTSGHDDDDEFDTAELILPSFDESEADAMVDAFGPKPFEAQAYPIDLKPESAIVPSKISRTASTEETPSDSINLYNTKPSFGQKNAESFESDVTINNDELEAAVQRIIEIKFGAKIERMIVQAIEKAVSREIAKIKKAILDESDSVS